jgi:hypothetical protein
MKRKILFIVIALTLTGLIYAIATALENYIVK